jgi:NitT/TauT family transport system permease protein
MANITQPMAHSGSDAAAVVHEVFLRDPSIAARRRENIMVVVCRVAIAAGFLGLWEFAAGRWVSEFWVSSPTGIAAGLLRLIDEGMLWPSLLATVSEAITGFAFGALFGITLGVVFGVNKVVARILDPFLIGFYSLPRVALIPLFILWFGIGFQTKVIFTALLVFFPIFMNTLSGIRNVDRDLIDVIRVMGASRFDTVTKIFVPSALTWVFAGLRISVPYALIGAIVAEMFTSNKGLGYLISVTANQFDTAGLFAVLLVTTILGLILDLSVRLIERHFLRWLPANS